MLAYLFPIHNSYSAKYRLNSLTLSLWHWLRAHRSWHAIHFFSIMFRNGRLLIRSYRQSFTYCLYNNAARSDAYKQTFNDRCKTVLILWNPANLIFVNQWDKTSMILIIQVHNVCKEKRQVKIQLYDDVLFLQTVWKQILVDLFFVMIQLSGT